jgi:hypothetical protein
MGNTTLMSTTPERPEVPIVLMYTPDQREQALAFELWCDLHEVDAPAQVSIWTIKVWRYVALVISDRFVLPSRIYIGAVWVQGRVSWPARVA